MPLTAHSPSRLRRILSMAVLAALPLSSAAAEQRAPLTYADTFNLQWVTDPQISPDGRWIVYVRRAMDIRSDTVLASLWLVSTDGAIHRPLCATSCPGNTPRWSPDGRRIAWTAPDGANGAQLFVHWLDSGSTAAITNLPDAPRGLAWSPDGTLLAFTMSVPAARKSFAIDLPKPPEGASWSEPPKVIDRMIYRFDGAGFIPDTFGQVFVVPAAGGATRQLTSGDFEHGSDAVFTADSKSVIVSANRRPDADLEPNDSELYRIDLDTGAMSPLTDRRGPDSQPLVSPDGKYLAWLGFDDRYQGYQVTQLYLRDLRTGQTRSLTATLDRDVEHPVFAADSRSLYFQYDDRGHTRIARMALDGRLQELADDLGGTDVTRPYSGGSFSVSRAGRIAYTQRSSKAPAELATGSGPRDRRRLTALNANGTLTRDLPEIERIEFKSKADGLP